MGSNDLRSKPLQTVVDEVQALSAVASEAQVRSVAAVAARCTMELADATSALADVAFTAKKQVVTRLDELAVQIKAHEQALTRASDAASAQTNVLLKWNKVLVVITGVYTFVTFLLLIATMLRRV